MGLTPYRERQEDGFYFGTVRTTTYDPTADPVAVTIQAAEQEETSPEPQPEDTSSLEDLTKAVLLEMAKTRGLKPANAAMSKGELITALASQ